ncbi:MAG TPA: hypothetical protein ENO00_03445 [Deltaproteobacteria bacterium]|nr:hypothetical protein [Deltaproteobacteria bacterium]
MKIPSRTEFYRIVCDMGMPDHIIIHSLQVSRVAILLVDAITATGIRINRDLVDAAVPTQCGTSSAIRFTSSTS